MIALLLGPLTRLGTFVLLGILALAGLATAAGAAIGPATAAEIAQLPAVRYEVDRYLDGLTGQGPVAQTTAPIAAGAVGLCLAIALGALRRRRSRSVLVSGEGRATLGVRPRALQAIATHLAQGVHGVTWARARVRPRRHTPRLRVDATHSRSVANIAALELHLARAPRRASRLTTASATVGQVHPERSRDPARRHRPNRPGGNAGNDGGEAHGEPAQRACGRVRSCRA